jgi:hypothetical protein
MNGDLSRVTFNPFKHFTSIVLQQGRVQMDADGNEQAAILLHLMRSLAADLIGQHGGPDDLFTNQDQRTGLLERICGFAIIGASGTAQAPTFFPDPTLLLQREKDALTQAFAAPQRFPLAITGGHYYVDGLLCENETTWLVGKQPYLERGNDQAIRDMNDGVYLLYLDIWERFVTSLEDPSLKEVALGGADTAGRTKLTWQVRIDPTGLTDPSDSCTAFNPAWTPILTRLQPTNRGLLKAMAKANDGSAEEDVCITSPEARYRGMENQLYRVEVHRGGPAVDNNVDNLDVAATFKWSRNNATVVATLKEKHGDRLIVSGLRDLSRWFKTGDWVEITHDALEFNGLPGTLVRLASVDGEVLTIDPYTTSGTIFEPGDMFENLEVRNLKVRGWDHTQPEEDLLIDGAIPIEEGDLIELEDGVQIFFETTNPAARYRTGDYWLIPARVATGDVEWPQLTVPDPNNATETIEVPKPVGPHGVKHHFAPLAAVTLANGAITQIVDLRHKFAPLGRCLA